jgi:phosphate transport system substrate-binding protein
MTATTTRTFDSEPRGRCLLSLAAACAAPGVLHAQPSLPPVTPQFAHVQWLVPAAASNIRQTAAEEEMGRRMGRALPRAEILQPTLDIELASFRPRCDQRLAGSLTVALSDTLPALMRLWIRAFRIHYPDVDIGVAPVYDGNFAAEELLKGNVGIAFLSRALKSDETAGFRSRFGYDPSTAVVSAGSWRHFGFADALGILVHKDNPLERITYGELDAIYSSTRRRGGEPITRWGQLGLKGEWAERPVHAYGIKPWDGFEDLVRQKILSVGGERGEWRADVRHEGVFPMARRIAQDPGAIGYTGLAYIDADVRVLPIGEGPTGPFHAPTYENVADARYPLSRAVYANANNPPDKPLDPVIEEFLRFILSRDGQQVVRDHAIFLPLRGWQVVAARSALLLERPGDCRFSKDRQ